jgi:hypothetical protein
VEQRPLLLGGGRSVHGAGLHLVHSEAWAAVGGSFGWGPGRVQAWPQALVGRILHGNLLACGGSTTLLQPARGVRPREATKREGRQPKAPLTRTQFVTVMHDVWRVVGRRRAASMAFAALRRGLPAVTRHVRRPAAPSLFGEKE